MIQFSATISIYKNDNPDDFQIALESIINQTLKPTEIIILQDGPVPTRLSAVADKFLSEYDNIRLVALPANQGHGKARCAAIEACRYEYVAIMDADDIAEPTRFEKQVSFLEAHPEVDVLGGQITEFINAPDNIVGKRAVPQNDADIKKYIKHRCPFNQVTVILKRSAVIAAGNYQHWHYDEDYYLWLRMYLNGAVFANLPDVLVNARVGKEMYARRGGWKYFKSEARLMWWMYRYGITGLWLSLYNIIIRFVLQVCMPNGLRSFIFRKLARKHD
ncbi:MAG: glycosyltransferase [Candidatus Aphodosoma sp.]